MCEGPKGLPPRIRTTAVQQTLVAGVLPPCTHCAAPSQRLLVQRGPQRLWPGRQAGAGGPENTANCFQEAKDGVFGCAGGEPDGGRDSAPCCGCSAGFCRRRGRPKPCCRRHWAQPTLLAASGGSAAQPITPPCAAQTPLACASGTLTRPIGLVRHTISLLPVPRRCQPPSGCRPPRTGAAPPRPPTPTPTPRNLPAAS